MEFTQKIRNFLDNFLPIKLAIGSVLSLLLGSGILAALSEVATYSYAIRIGVRPPLEGIPYLRAAVLVGSFLLTLGISLTLILARSVLLSITAQAFDWYENRSLKSFKLPFEIPKELRSRFSEEISLGTILISILVAEVLLGGVGYLIGSLGENYSAHIAGFKGALIAVVYGAFILTAWQKSAAWFISVGFAVILYSTAILGLFSLEPYSKFLRLIGYGGGIHTVVTYKLDPEGSSTISCSLLLRTIEYLICTQPIPANVFEIPIQDITKVDYDYHFKSDKNVDVWDKKFRSGGGF